MYALCISLFALLIPGQVYSIRGKGGAGDYHELLARVIDACNSQWAADVCIIDQSHALAKDNFKGVLIIRIVHPVLNCPKFV